MKKKKVIFFIFLSFFCVSSVMASTLTFKGYGAWRDQNNGGGEYASYSNVNWKKCRNYCVESRNCKGVEYSVKSSGISDCEVHTGALHHIKRVNNSSLIGLIWVRK